MPLWKGSLSPHSPIMWASPTMLPYSSSTNSWQQTRRWSRVTLLEVRTSTSGSYVRPSNILPSHKPPLSALPTQEERQPFQHGRRSGSRSASFDNTRRVNASTKSSGWFTPPWRTSSSLTFNNTYISMLKNSTQGTPRRRRWITSIISTSIITVYPPRTFRIMMRGSAAPKMQRIHSKDSLMGSISAPTL